MKHINFRTLILIEFFIGNSNFDIDQITSRLQGVSITLKSQFTDLDDLPCNVPCLLCDSSFILPSKEQDFLTHLLNEHQLVIGDVEKIASLKRYLFFSSIKNILYFQIYIKSILCCKVIFDIGE